LLVIAWFVIAAVFVGVPVVYYLQMKRWAALPWKLDIDENYLPSVAVLIPVHNEEKTIRLKLENLAKVKYPVEKIETVIVNDASTDGTISEISQYADRNRSLKINVFDSKEHIGKTNCLNRALKSVNADIVIISDADCFWPSDMLLKALPYLSDPGVGAITGRELLLNPKSSWVTVGEQFYNGIVQSIRIGESKMHSTIFFQGGFAAYKHNLFRGFNHEADDSGTALDMVQRKSRTLLIPEIGFYTVFPTSWRNKLSLKVRRASQLQRLWIKCLKLLLRGKLAIPKRIVVSNVFLHLLSPLLLAALAVLSVFVFFQFPLFLLAFLLILCATLLFKRTRTLLVEVLQSNFILFLALAHLLVGNGSTSWKTTQESRFLLTEDMLKEKQLL
jgi:biofilm PGA synthesis N-glycosyltransferase PgaC